MTSPFDASAFLSRRDVLGAAAGMTALATAPTSRPALVARWL